VTILNSKTSAHPKISFEVKNQTIKWENICNAFNINISMKNLSNVFNNSLLHKKILFCNLCSAPCRWLVFWTTLYWLGLMSR
jgi:hypothetical protein